MKKLLIFIFAFTCFIATVSCTRVYCCEEEALELIVEGINADHKKGKYYGIIPSTGVQFFTTGTGDHLRWGFVTAVYFNGEEQTNNNSRAMPPPDLDTPPHSGKWGSFKYLTENPPYVIEFNIPANNTKKENTIEFRFGVAGYQYTSITLKQPPYIEKQGQ